MDLTIEEVIEKIIQVTKKSKEEVLQLIEKEKEKFGGLLTSFGAACVVANNYGIKL